MRVYVEPAQPQGALALEWACAEQAVPESTKARGAPVMGSVPVPVLVVARAQRLRASRVAQPPALATARERALARAPVRGGRGAASSPFASRARCFPTILNESPLNKCPTR